MPDSLALVSGRDWFDWTSFIFTIGGAIITVVALIYTFKEAREAKHRASEAKTSADAAREAANHAIETMAEKFTVSDLARIGAGLREIQVAMRGTRYESALVQLQSLRSQVHRLRSRPEFASEERRLGLQEIVVSLRKIQEELERKLEDADIPVSVSTTNNALAKHIAQLDEWGEEVALKPTRSNDA